MANSSRALPSFSLTASGTSNLTHTVSIDTATLWDASLFGFSKETLTGAGTHNPELQWTLTPVVSEPQLEALNFACLWAVTEATGGGAPPPGSRIREVLRESTIADAISCPPEVIVSRIGEAIKATNLVNSINVFLEDETIRYIRVYDENGILTDDVDFAHISSNDLLAFADLVKQIATLGLASKASQEMTKGLPRSKDAATRLTSLASQDGTVNQEATGTPSGTPAPPEPNPATTLLPLSSGSLSDEQLNRIRNDVTKILGHPIPRKKEFHFGVASQLERLAQCHPGWLHVAPKHAVPWNACYKATCGDMAVWVTEEGMAGLSEFVLILLDIGTADPATLAVASPTASVTTIDSADIVSNFRNTVTQKWRICQELTPSGAGKIELLGPATNVKQKQLPPVETPDTEKHASKHLSFQAKTVLGMMPGAKTLGIAAPENGPEPTPAAAPPIPPVNPRLSY